ncbi:MAG TPA: hypothetical protein VJ691_00205 [Vicinamibacterales bacterium]|nr:hypothetical protein [Vicinamibacterales bacterium]
MQRLQIMNSILAIVVLLLLGVIAWQGMRISALDADLQQAQRSLESGVERMAAERIRSLRREEMVSAVQWLDDFYRSKEGLQRPTGLWRPDLNKPDAEAIGVWVLDVYLQARLTGKSDAEARQAVADQIKSTDEWRRKHPKT